MFTVKIKIELRWVTTQVAVFQTELDWRDSTEQLEKQLLQLAFDISKLADTCPLEFEFVLNGEVNTILTNEDGDKWSLTNRY